jgi:glycolate oxidase
MIPDRVIRELTDLLGPENILTRRDDLIPFATDATKLSYMPDAVAFPRNAQDISGILVLANQEGFPVIPRGAGSGKSGGAVPVERGLVLSMDRFNRILLIDPSNLIAKVEPGVVTSVFQEEVEKLGLFYPPDPASIKISTIGGNVAENAGGLRAVKYGVTRDYVLGMTAVLPTGEIIRTGVETAKGVVGYDLTRLLVGSEGTLAVITDVTLRLVPRPASTRTMMALFRTVSAAVETVSEITRHRMIPTALEFMDKLCIDCVRDELGLPLPPECGALLLIEVDGDKALTRREAKKIREVCLQSGAMEFLPASRKKEAEKLWEARRNVSPAVYRLRPDKVSEDVVVPRTRMAELCSFLEALSIKHDLPIAAYGHAGDGNIHVNVLFDKNVPGEARKVDEVVRDLFKRVLDMKGTISGEHGIGLTKAPYLSMELSGPAIELMARIKLAFDPKGILNPGKIFPYKS